MNECPNQLSELSDEQFMQVFKFAHQTVTIFSDVDRSEYNGKIHHIKIIRCAFPGIGLKAAKFFSEMALEYRRCIR